MQLVLLQNLLQSSQLFTVELYLRSLVKLLSRRLELQRNQLDYTQSVVQSSLSTESDSLVLETSLLQAVQRKQLELQKNLQDYTSSKEQATKHLVGRLTSDLVLMVDSLEREFPRNIQKHILEMHHNTLGVDLLLLALSITMMDLEIYSLLVVLVNLSLQIHQKILHSLQLLVLLEIQRSSRIMLDLVPMVDSLVHVSKELHQQKRWMEPSHSVAMLYSTSSTSYLLVETSLHLVVLQKELQAILQRILHSLLLEEPKTKRSVQHLTSDQVLQVYLDSQSRNIQNVMSVMLLNLPLVVQFYVSSSYVTTSVLVPYLLLVMVLRNIQNVILDLEIYLLLVVLLRLSQPIHQKAQSSSLLLVNL